MDLNATQDLPRIRAVPAVTRAMAILRLVARNRAPLTVKTIADTLGLVPSTALHIVRALVAEEMLQAAPHTKRYGLGVGVLPFARALLEHSDFPNLARPKLEAIANRHEVMVTATEAPNLEHMIVVAIASAPAMVRLHVDVGSRIPALAASGGRCLAAYGPYSDRQIEERFRRLKREMPPYEDWLKQVEQTRRDGFYVDQRYMAGLTITAVPILGTRATLFPVLSAVGITEQLTEARRRALVEDMRVAAAEVGAQLRSTT